LQAKSYIGEHQNDNGDYLIMISKETQVIDKVFY
jgi:hypothetical protein